MSKDTRYTDEFKQEVVNQISHHGYRFRDVANQLDTNSKTLYILDHISVFTF